jgi:hypothetical protein
MGTPNLAKCQSGGPLDIIRLPLQVIVLTGNSHVKLTRLVLHANGPYHISRHVS